MKNEHLSEFKLMVAPANNKEKFKKVPKNYGTGNYSSCPKIKQCDGACNMNNELSRKNAMIKILHEIHCLVISEN